MEKLNVCLMNDSFPPSIDGVANTTLNYAKIINSSLGNASVVTPKYPNVNDDYNFDVYRYTSYDTTKIIGYRAGMPFGIKLLGDLSKCDFDIIHSHCPVSSTFLARLLRDTIKKPIIMTYHTKFDYDIKKAINNKLIQEAAIKVLISNISAVDEVWAVSKGAGENLKSLGYKGDYFVMNNGVDFSKGKIEQSIQDTVAKKYKIVQDKSKPIFLFVGRMMWYKGIKIILDALEEVNKRKIDFQMIFVGKGSDLIDIKEYAKECEIFNKCIFTGAVTDRSELKALFSLSDLFLFPSVYDTNGIVVREAAATGLASVLIENSCASEDTINGRNCFWIKEDYQQLAKLLIANKDNINYYHQIGQNAQNDLYISWQDAVTRAYERYKEVIKEKQDNLNINYFKITENMLNLYSNLSSGINKARDLYENILEHFEQYDFEDDDE